MNIFHLRAIIRVSILHCLLASILLLAQPATRQAPSPVASPDRTLADLEREIKSLEDRQKLTIDTMQETYRNGFWFLGFIVVVSSVMSIFRQFEERRLLKYQELQLAEAKELGKSYKANLDGTFALMGSVKNVIEFFKDAQVAADQIKRLETAFAAETDQWEKQIAVLNEKAVKLSPACKRHSHNDPEIQRALHDFHDECQVVRGHSTTTPLNANVHFLLGFHHRIQARYDEALEEFANCIQMLREHRREVSIANYSGLPAGTVLQTWLTKLENICSFHTGILRANLGQYELARNAFETALGCDGWDYESLSYIPEVTFLGGLASFDSVVSTFVGAIERIRNMPEDQERKFSRSKSSLLAMLNLKLANCYMADSAHSDYRAHRDLTMAEQHLTMALDCDADSLFARLALAQLYHLTNREPVKRAELFGAVFAGARAIVTRVSEAKILMMYYYILLIASTLGQIKGETPALYALRIYEIVPLLPKPKELRIFSPRSKTDLRVDAFTGEVQAFEREWAPSRPDLAAGAASRREEVQPDHVAASSPKSPGVPQSRAAAAATFGTSLLGNK